MSIQNAQFDKFLTISQYKQVINIVFMHIYKRKHLLSLLYQKKAPYAIKTFTFMPSYSKIALLFKVL